MGKLHRREAMFYMGAAAVSLPAIIKGLVTTPDIDLPHESIAYGNPGWLEASLPERPAFISGNDGHKDFLIYMCIVHPVLRHAVTEAYQDIKEHTSFESTKLGDMFEKHMGFARHALQEIMRDDNPSIQNILHVAFYSFAAVYSPYFTIGQINERFGVAFDDAPSHAVLWDVDSLRYSVPRVLPLDASECNGTVKDTTMRCSGVDRAVHFAQHAVLAHLVDYFFGHRLPDRNRIPNGAWLMASFYGNSEQLARNFAVTAHIAWETEETIHYFQGASGEDDNGKPIVTGFLDPHVDKDYYANMLGCEFALTIANSRDWVQVTESIDSLNEEQGRASF